MNHIEATKSDAKVTASVAANATHTHEIDTIGHEYLSVDVVFGAFTAATAQYATVLKLQHSDVSGSGFTDLPAFTVASPGAGSTTGAKNGAVCRFNADLRILKRFVNVVATPGNSAAVATVARLGRSHEMPISAGPAGVNTFVSG